MIQRDTEYTEADIGKTVIYLQMLGMDLKGAIEQLASSSIKYYLMMEVAKFIELKTAEDFYYLQNKILRMLRLVIRFELEGKILKILEEINLGIKKIVQYIESEVEREIFK